MKIIFLLLVVLFAGMYTEAQNVQPTPPKAQAASKSATRPEKKPETPHLEFVTEYIRELAAVEEIRAAGESELKQDPQSAFTNGIHTGTLMQLELGSQINALKQMHLDDPFDNLIPNITGFYQEKIELWQRVIDICSAFVGSPKSDVDYDKLTVEMPKLRARQDFIDKALFEATPAIFLTLVDMKSDSKGHTSHLLITKAEREALIKQIDTDFGPKLDEKGANYTVSAAAILKEGLKKDFKSSDDPWD
jgi:hypothetical protein